MPMVPVTMRGMGRRVAEWPNVKGTNGQIRTDPPPGCGLSSAVCGLVRSVWTSFGERFGARAVREAQAAGRGELLVGGGPVAFGAAAGWEAADVVAAAR